MQTLTGALVGAGAGRAWNVILGGGGVGGTTTAEAEAALRCGDVSKE